MQLKRITLLLFIFLIIGAVVTWKLWQQQTTSEPIPSTLDKGPAVILFRGDNSPGCRAIDQLVEQAAVRHGKQINFAQMDWAADNPLIKKYQVRFLPTVIFVNKHDKEVGRIIGESPAVQQKLRQALAQLEDILGH